MFSLLHGLFAAWRVVKKKLRITMDMDKKQEVKDGLKNYLRQEQYVKEMFTIDREDGK